MKFLLLVTVLVSISPIPLLASPTSSTLSCSNSTEDNPLSFEEKKRLFKSAFSGDIEAIANSLRSNKEGTLRARCGFSGQQHRGSSLLHASIKHPKIVELLLAEGMNVDNPPNSGITPLAQAIYQDEIETARTLLEHGANPNLIANHRGTILANALYHGADISTIKLLIENGAYNTVGGKQNHESLLHIAALTGATDAAQLFIDRGVNVNITDNQGRTPLYWSISASDLDYANEDNKNPTRTYNDFTQMLLDNGANPDEMSAQYFAWSGNTTLVKLALSRGVSVDERDRFGRTPLHMAAMQNNLELAKLLVDKGADVNAISNNPRAYKYERAGFSPLYYAIILGGESEFYIEDTVDIELVEFLLKKGADVNFKTSFGHSIFKDTVKRAGSKKHNQKPIEVAKILLKYGADIHEKDLNDNTLLFSVNESEYPRIITFLVENGIDVNAQNKDGITALMRTLQYWHPQPKNVQLLLELGANPHLKTNDGGTAIDYLNKGIQARNWYIERQQKHFDNGLTDHPPPKGYYKEWQIDDDIMLGLLDAAMKD